MSLILRLLGQTPTPARNVDDDRWWGGAAATSTAGPRVDADTALKISAVYACVGLLAETIASLPLVVYRWLENNDGRERARNHPLYAVLHDQPNETQTAFGFREMMMAHALLRGSGYARIVPGARGFADQLVPVHPDLVSKERLGNGRIRYLIQEGNGGKRPFNQEDIFEVGGLSLDGVNTLSVVSYARDSLGIALAAEQYGGRFYRNDSRPGGVLKTPKKLSTEAGQRLKASWEAAHTSGNQHRVAVLEEGLEWQKIGVTPDEAQFLQTREFQAEDVCRWFRVPPHMIGLTSKATSWGSGIEQMSIGFVTYTLRPWLTRWSQAIRRDLILATDTYFADFVLEELLRGDIASRYNAYAIARQWGWLSVNDIRRRENENPIPNGDVYLTPMNMEPAAMAGEQGSRFAGVQGHYRLLAEEAAGRVVRKEVAAMTRLYERLGSDREAWATAVFDFYGDHAAFVAQTMRMPLAEAATYAEAGQRELLTGGIEAMADWPVRRMAALVDAALGAALPTAHG